MSIMSSFKKQCQIRYGYPYQSGCQEQCCHQYEFQCQFQCAYQFQFQSDDVSSRDDNLLTSVTCVSGQQLLLITFSPCPQSDLHS